MKKIFLPILILTLLISGCQSNSAQEDTANSTAPAAQDNSTQAAGEEPAQNDQDTSSPAPALEQPLETLGPDCYGEEIHPIGQSIADLYPEQTNYEQVMVWFCNGFEFEDIMTALQTAEGSDFSAEDLLAKFEHGQTWDEIWAELGIVEP